MKTIEDLKVEKTFYRREKDFFGNVIRTPYNKFIPRKPKVVSPGVRFGYSFIDFFIIFIIQFLFGLIFKIFAIQSKSIDTIIFLGLLSQLVSLSIFLFYYAIFETYLGGSVGKLICGYTVINNRAERITFGHGMLRSVIRMVPFEAFSCLSDRGWHDRWSKTYVVKRSEKTELQRLLGTLLNRQEDLLD